ncbi:medium-chain acyl-CoA ligase ACSF2, mitochondrial-like isoform X2 [Branchiostoma floridae x Branchiostoma japonicum]
MSYIKSPTDFLLVEGTFGQLLDDTAASWPDTVAYVFKKTGSRITFADILDKANRLAAGLKAIGTERGDVVAWLVGHRPEWIYLYFAVAKLGAIALPLQAHRVGRSNEAMTYSLKKAGAKILVMGDITGVDQGDDTVPYLCSLFPEVETAKPGNLQIKRLPKLTSIIVLGDTATGIGTYNMDDVLMMGSDAKIIAEVTALQDQLDCHDPFQLVFTSGSTGQPKCVEHSTYSVFNMTRLASISRRMLTEATALYPYLSNPLAVATPLFIPGFTLVIPVSAAPSSVEIMKAIQEERCQTAMILFMKDFHDLIHNRQLGEYDLSSLQTVNVVGNFTPKSLIDRAADVLPNVKIMVVYGMKELPGVSVATENMIGEGKGSTVGKLLPHVEMQLVDKDGKVVPLGHEGEIWLKGFKLFKRYRGDEEKTSKAITPDGWYKTEDLGALDEHGVLKLFGRVPVVSVPDPASVEEICACIILKEGQTTDPEEMKTYCVKIGMVPIELPGYFIFLDEFPVTTTMQKVDRKKLRLIAMEKLGLPKES